MGTLTRAVLEQSREHQASHERVGDLNHSLQIMLESHYTSQIMIVPRRHLQDAAPAPLCTKGDERAGPKHPQLQQVSNFKHEFHPLALPR